MSTHDVNDHRIIVSTRGENKDVDLNLTLLSGDYFWLFHRLNIFRVLFYVHDSFKRKEMKKKKEFELRPLSLLIQSP